MYVLHILLPGVMGGLTGIDGPPTILMFKMLGTGG
jgi:hypothetical protein